MGLGLAVGVVEVAARLVPTALPPSVQAALNVGRFRTNFGAIYAHNAAIGKWMLRPGVDVEVSTVEFAYRMRTVSLGAPEVGWRDDGMPAGGPVAAVALGDSFTEGYGVPLEHTWVHRVEARTGRQVVNMGVSGNDFGSNGRILELYGLRLAPGLVLWGVTPNDFQIEPTPPRRRWVEPALRLLRQRSVTYELAKFAAGVGSYAPVREGFHPYRDGRLDLLFAWGPWVPLLGPERRRLGSEEIRTALGRARALTSRAGAELVLFFFPAKEHVYWPLASRALADPAAYRFEPLVEDWRRACAALGLRCLDLTPGFQARAGEGEQLYFRIDGHWNRAGHELAADLILAYLRQEGLL